MTPSENMLWGQICGTAVDWGEWGENQNRNEMRYYSVESINIAILEMELNHI